MEDVSNRQEVFWTFIILTTALSALVYAPVVSYMSEWFVHRRGLANGIVFMGELTLQACCIFSYSKA